MGPTCSDYRNIRKWHYTPDVTSMRRDCHKLNVVLPKKIFLRSSICTIRSCYCDDWSHETCKIRKYTFGEVFLASSAPIGYENVYRRVKIYKDRKTANETELHSFPSIPQSTDTPLRSDLLYCLFWQYWFSDTVKPPVKSKLSDYKYSFQCYRWKHHKSK